MAAVKLSKRERNLAMIALGFAIFYIFYQFLLTPKIAEIEKFGNQVRQLRLNLEVAENKIKILEAIEKNVKFRPKETKQKIVVEEKALEVLRALSQTTTRSKLKLLSIRPMITKGATLKFDLRCQGTYQQLYDFLEILHGLDILILIDSLDVTGSRGEVTLLDIKIMLTAHF